MKKEYTTWQEREDEFFRNAGKEVLECMIFTGMVGAIMVICTYLALGSPWQ